MKLTTFKNGSRLAIPAIFAALFLVASTVTLYYYSATLSKKGLYAIAGTQENYSWSIAKFSIKLAEFDTLVEQQSHAAQVDNDNLRLRFEILYSRFYVLETVSESTQPLYAEPGYPEVVKQMRLQMDRIDKLLSSRKIDFGQVSAAMRAIKPYAIEMANLTDHAEVKQRTAAYEDYIEKRHIIFYGLVIVMFSVIALIAITLIVFRQQRLTIRQQAKAIEAEKATRTKNAFLGAIGHELRTSLQSVMSAIDVLVNTRVSAEHADTFQRLETAAQQIESQMKDLTDYAHLDSGMMELRIVPFDAQKLIAETANEIATLTRKEQVKQALLQCLAKTVDVVKRHRVEAAAAEILGQLIDRLMRIVQYRDAQPLVVAEAGPDFDQIDAVTRACRCLIGAIDTPLPFHAQRHKFRRPPGRKLIANVPDARHRHPRHEKDGIARHVWLGGLVFGA
ncbi:Signal transduction histidine-protein kinase BarA [Serratia marcescens]|nr:Signal transduction histidine-protein kinase BarA [Serratia marcescens]